VENLVTMTEIKLSAAARKFSSVEVKDEKVMLQRNNDYVLLGAKFPRLSAMDPAEKLRELLALVRSF
jgi:transcription-repair coupling factor (superfamily II helicase)